MGPAYGKLPRLPRQRPKSFGSSSPKGRNRPPAERKCTEACDGKKTACLARAELFGGVPRQADGGALLAPPARALRLNVARDAPPRHAARHIRRAEGSSPRARNVTAESVGSPKRLDAAARSFVARKTAGGRAIFCRRGIKHPRKERPLAFLPRRQKAKVVIDRSRIRSRAQRPTSIRGSTLCTACIPRGKEGVRFQSTGCRSTDTHLGRGSRRIRGSCKTGSTS